MSSFFWLDLDVTDCECVVLLKFVLHVFGNLLIFLFQTFCKLAKCLKQLKLASTHCKMFENVLFSFCCSYSCLFYLKKTISNVEFSFHQLNHQSLVTFSYLTPFFFHSCSRKDNFSDLKHFYDRRLHFQQMKV